TNTVGFTSEWTYRASYVLRAKKSVKARLLTLRSMGTNEFRPGDHALSISDIQSVQRFGLMQEDPKVRTQNSSEAPPWAPAGQKNSVEVIATGERTGMGFDMQNVRYDLQR